MKKRLSVILILMLFLPFTINAASTYNNGVTKSNNYIISFENYKRYILIPTKSKFYSYEKSGYVNNNEFKNGGFISSYEYNLSIYNNVSWLAPGVGYWTLSKANNNEYYCISNILYSKNANDMSEVRVTQYIQPSSIIKGNGTITNPWYFVETFTIKLKSNNEEYGNLGTSSNPGPQEIYVEKGSTKSTDYIVTPGYEISTSNISNCFSDYFLVNNNKLTIRSLDRDLNCVINFEPKNLKVKLDSAGGEITSNTLNVIYSQEYGEIPTPTRKGYIFEGWYTKTTGGTKVTAETKVTETKDHTLYAHWRADGIGCGDLTYKCSNILKGTNPILEYTGDCDVTCDKNNWKVKFLTSGNLTTNELLNVDVFLVGGGAGGGYAAYSDLRNWGSSEWWIPGNGGGGGYTKTIKNINIVSSNTYKITIGTGGKPNKNGESTSLEGNDIKYKVNGGEANGKGGSGGGAACDGNGSLVAGYEGSGGKGGKYGNQGKKCYTYTLQGDYDLSGGAGQKTTTCEFEQSKSGNNTDLTGCAPEVKAYSRGGTGAGSKKGANNTGNGGDGASAEGLYNDEDNNYREGYPGGSGIVIIRNKR